MIGWPKAQCMPASTARTPLAELFTARPRIVLRAFCSATAEPARAGAVQIVPKFNYRKVECDDLALPPYAGNGIARCARYGEPPHWPAYRVVGSRTNFFPLLKNRSQYHLPHGVGHTCVVRFLWAPRFGRIDSFCIRGFSLMAKLIPCRICGRELASDADIACPGCGTPDPTGRKGKKKRIEKLLFLLVIAVTGSFGIWTLTHSGSSDPISTAIRHTVEDLLTKLR